MDFYQFCDSYYLFFMIMVQFYFLCFGLITLKYAFKSRSHPMKVNHPEYFTGELMISIMFFVLIVFYPFLFNQIGNFSIRAQIYFHLWDALTVNLIVWYILINIWKHNDKKKGIIKPLPDEWYHSIEEKYIECDEKVVNSGTGNIGKGALGSKTILKREDKVKNKDKIILNKDINNITRKRVHFIYAAIILGVHYLGVALASNGGLAPGWDAISFNIWTLVSVILNYLWIMMIFDNVRLIKYDEAMSLFMRKGAEKSLKSDEYYTYTSAPLLLLALIPFVAFNPPAQLLYSVWLIAAISDAIASIIGIKYGKRQIKKIHPKKTVEGYVSGAFTTYIIIFLVNFIIPFPGLDYFKLNILAIVTAIVFLFVDLGVFGKNLTDNFLNPLMCGIAMVVTYNILFVI